MYINQLGTVRIGSSIGIYWYKTLTQYPRGASLPQTAVLSVASLPYSWVASSDLSERCEEGHISSKFTSNSAEPLLHLAYRHLSIKQKHWFSYIFLFSPLDMMFQPKGKLDTNINQAKPPPLSSQRPYNSAYNIQTKYMVTRISG